MHVFLLYSKLNIEKPSPFERWLSIQDSCCCGKTLKLEVELLIVAEDDRPSCRRLGFRLLEEPQELVGGHARALLVGHTGVS